MKKIILLLMAIILAMPSTFAQSKKLQKMREKEYKSKMKEYKKEGWKIFGTSRTLEVALLTHYEKLNTLGEDGYEVVGVGSKSATKSIAKDKAVNNAVNTYAQAAGSTVRGRIVSDVASNGVDISGDFEHFYAAYERAVEKEIKNEMIESFSVIHEVAGGGFEVQTFYIINESAASKARIRAMENAMKESEAAQKYAKKVADFVKEGLEQQ